MNELFGLSMNYIMIALLILLGVALGTVAWVALRNRVLFFIGVRNIPRRRAQTTLIIIGLMLSTLIISTAFSIGDTVSYSITNQVYNHLHSIDEIVQVKTGDDNSDTGGGPTSVTAPAPIPGTQASALAQQFRSLPGVDGALPVLRSTVPMSNPRASLTEPLTVLVGLDPASMKGFESDIQSVDGKVLSIGDLAAGEVYVDKSLADKLEIVVGDKVQVFSNGQPHEFTVKAIVVDRTLTGNAGQIARGSVMQLQSAQQLLGRPNEVDLIAVSNTGGVRDGLNDSKSVTAALDSAIGSAQLSATKTKQDDVDTANQAASFLTTFFIVLGLFAIASGMMLIFLIFVMLAAERRVEMGMMRAVGIKRLHLTETFLAEGMTYNVMAAAVGCALGVAVSLGMVRIMAILFSGFGLSVHFNVSPRSLIVSYSLGVVLTFLTVTFSSWRISNLNVVAAVRDMAESSPRPVRPSVSGLGGLLRYGIWLLFKPTSWRTWWTSSLVWIGGVVLLALSSLFYIAGVSIYGSSSAAGVAAVLLFVAGVMVSVAALVIAFTGFFRIFQLGGLSILLGIPLMALGLATELAFPAGVGMSLMIAGAALTAIQVGVPERLAATTAGLVLLVAWLLLAGGQLLPNLDGGPEMFFLSGVTMILSSTFVLVYNADIMLGLLTRVGVLFSSLIPSIRTAVAYPLANKFRTGMTIAMISLVMFALVMISTMNANFSRIFLGDEPLGGYQVVVTENPNNHIGDVKGAMIAQGGDAAAAAASITEVDEVRLANSRVAQVRNTPRDGLTADDTKFENYQIVGPSTGFIDHNGVKLDSRADGYGTDAEVWKTLETNPNAAIIDTNALGGGGGFGGSSFSLAGVKQGDKTFKPVHVQVRDATNPDVFKYVEIIGIIGTKASALYSGLYLAPTTFDAVYAKPESSLYALQLAPGANAVNVAKSIEKALSNRGVQADSLRKIVDDFQAQSQGFLYLIQGFMGIGLFVGIAAVGVVAFRTVVERRQQIGMLRAIGYTRNAVAISFLMESSFVAALGVLSGIGLALLLAYQLLTSDELGRQGITSFYIPWLQIIAIGGFAFLASLLMTIIPSRQASSIPIADALRYE
jgi:putative ABC transport system permease protein